ncbi:MAG: pyridoxal 5'-phosphate synthase glutaminase subunit PdxT [Candidatus Dormibacteraeota bacterium]|nr:pyridoxal 5'-phosphate synthase glutaminase subunit PdxT [Candidatus Dormibacteraeota bacterium]
MSAPRVGVLALQGAFREHIEILATLGVEAFAVRTAAELQAADALVLPGGESTTMDKLLRKFELQQPLRCRLRGGLPALATCAGLILLARDVLDGLPDQESLAILPISARRNGYGRQPDSFERDLTVEGLDAPFRGVFIRAPVITAVDAEVEVLAEVEDRPVAVGFGAVVGLTFHPELTGDGRLHRLFLERVAESRHQRSEARGA